MAESFARRRSKVCVMRLWGRVVFRREDSGELEHGFQIAPIARLSAVEGGLQLFKLLPVKMLQLAFRTGEYPACSVSGTQMKILTMTSTFEFPLSPKLFDLHVYTRRPGSSAVVPGLDHDVVRAGSHFQVSIESLAVLLILQPVIDVNLNGEHGARARDRGVNVNR